MDKSRSEDEQMEDLMTCADKVEAMRKPSPWQLRSISLELIPMLQVNSYPRCVKASAYDIEGTHQDHPLKRKSFLLDRKAIEEDTM